MASQHELLEADAFSQVLENRINGFWNKDYFQNIIVPLLNLKPGDRVLDVGAGNGALTLLLARHLPDVHFTGIDLTPNLVEEATGLAQKLGLANVTFQEGNALYLPFEDNSFDATVCQTVLMHVPDPGRAVTEMSRVLKKDGRFMAIELHLLTYDKPVESTTPPATFEEEVKLSRYMQLLVHGYRLSGHGDMKIGGRVPFFAVQAGLQIVDVRINDRAPHAFPPYNRVSDKASLAEVQGWEGIFKDSAYRNWITDCMVAAGGTKEDADAWLNQLPAHSKEVFSPESKFAFVWLLNPIMIITIAKK